MRAAYCARVGVEVEFLAVPFERGQALEVADQMHGSVGVNRQIGELGGAVTSDAAATETVQAEHDVLVEEVPAGIGADASAFFRGVVGVNGVGAVRVPQAALA